MGEVDGIHRWALHQLQKLIQRVQEAYDKFEFHIIFHELNRFCTVDLSAFYLDILKDRLYTSGKESAARRNAQKVFFEMITVLARLMAPILAFTAEEIWQSIPDYSGKEKSVHLTSFPKPDTHWIDESLASRWDSFFKLRSEILKGLEKARQAKMIGNSLEAKLVIIAEGDPKRELESFNTTLTDLLQVSQVEWGMDISESAMKSEQFPTLFMDVKKADGKKCDRCWRWNITVGDYPDHPTVCDRCYEVVK